MSISSPSESRAFDLAKQTLALVGEHQTAPTPKVYEVWYRYAEGKCDPIKQQLDHRINETGTVSEEFLEQLYDQFCTPRDNANDRVSYELGKELIQLQQIILSQMSAGEDFSSSINTANEVIGLVDCQLHIFYQCIDLALEK